MNSLTALTAGGADCCVTTSWPLVCCAVLAIELASSGDVGQRADCVFELLPGAVLFVVRVDRGPRAGPELLVKIGRPGCDPLQRVAFVLSEALAVRQHD